MESIRPAKKTRIIRLGFVCDNQSLLAVVKCAINKKPIVKKIAITALVGEI